MKKFLIALVVLGVAIAIIVIGLNQFFKNKIVYFLDNALANNITLHYDKVSVDTWGGGVTLKDAYLKIAKRGDTLVNTKIKTEIISISGVSYWEYFIENTVHIEEIKVDNNAIWFLNDRSVSKPEEVSGPINLGKKIKIDRIDIGDTSLKILKPGEALPFLKVPRASFSIEDITIDRDLVKRKIPLSYSGMLLEADSIFLNVSKYDNLTIGSMKLQKEDIVLQNTQIKTAYSKTELSRKIKIERDHIDLQIPEFRIGKIVWGFAQDTLFTKAGTMHLNKPTLEIYRDKLVADDKTTKPLYSKLLRSIPFDIMLDSLTIEDATIVYREKVKEDRPAGEINFSKLDVKASDLGNTYKRGSDTTKLAINGFFLDTAPLSIDWSFDVQDPNDTFNIKGFMGQMPAASINSFTESNLRAKMVGQVERVYFNINGNDDQSTIDIRMKYDDFKIEILNKESKKNKFFSAIANLFVPKDSKGKNEEGYRAGRGNTERDKTKSFFNYLWLNLKDGLVEVLLGDGRK
ncbi:hypothetical protein [Flavimarina sp. Hel_I_48]|uniref:hypothetical protein n=1 Tax=Flavimarina sp. Hel_I_48 TaxID=1392488 RepID=UPI0004DF847D|nr:hypothetical protein [Flavimarina sp. Hel_I_48]